ncbi:MAG: radical SAM protein [Oscillatoria sp. SIO1A7]|nr:radical SAM protein [Oscillatoria sp. SIO1A7]
MAKLQYQGYSESDRAIPVAEKFGSANLYRRQATSLLNPATGFIKAYDFTLNPYQGCQYGCGYCYAAAFSPHYKMRQDWGNWIIVKENAAELMEKELASWERKQSQSDSKRPPKIYMSTVTDPYQPIESKEKITRSLLEVMVAYQPILVIQTRSPMVVRDMEILKKFRHLRINMSVPTGSESVRKDFEPRSPSIKARLKAIATLRHGLPCDELHDVRCSVTATPLLPTYFKDQIPFINKMQVVDRVVIQPFHNLRAGALTAVTRQEAIAIVKKYDWWYQNEEENYKKFKRLLQEQLSAVEIKEGQSGFTYE